LRIYLHPAFVVVVHERWLFRHQALSTQVRRLDAQAAPGSGHDVIALLQEMLAQGQYRGLSAKVVLSSHLLKYRIAPWHAQLSEIEQVRLLKHQFEEIYGGQAAGWKVFLSNSGFRKHEMACAVEAEFIDAIRLALKPHQIRLLGIQPTIVAALNYWRRQLRLASWLLIVEDGIVTLAGLSGHGWESVRTQATAGKIELSQLALMLERESLHAGSAMADTNVALFWPGQEAQPDMLLGKPVQILAVNGTTGVPLALHPEAALAMV